MVKSVLFISTSKSKYILFEDKGFGSKSGSKDHGLTIIKIEQSLRSTDYFGAYLTSLEE
ncbi:MAG: hypothetical protein ACI9Z3_000232 [Roseivirga sp.]|jgi:hypothetical protein